MSARVGRFQGAPTLDRTWGAEPSSDGVTRRARIRVDEVREPYPTDGEKPDFAYVHLLQRPRVGQPVVWASRGTNALTLYRSDMKTGGIAFVVTGLVFGDVERRL